MQPFKDQTFVDGALWSACLMVIKALESLDFI